MAIKYCVHDGPRGTGDGSSVANAWSFDNALANLTNADVLYVCNTGIYDLTGTVKSWTGIGTADTPLKIVGADASGNSYAGTSSMVTLNGSGMTTGNNLFAYGTANYIRYQNIRFTAVRNHGHHITTATTLWFYDCRVDNSVGYGISPALSTATVFGHRSQLDSNAWGVRASAASIGRVVLFDCTINNNSSGGIYDSLYTPSNRIPILNGCLIFRNGGPGVQYLGGSGYSCLQIDHCVFFENTSHGLVLPNSTCGEFVVKNSIFLDNGGYGINTATTTDLNKFVFQNICSYGNTSGDIDINSGVLLGSGHVLEDPAFLSETDGSEDLTPTNTNLTKSFAYPAGGTKYFWIGAIQPQIKATFLLKLA